jgi:amidophosphoribosyltransferase
VPSNQQLIASRHSMEQIREMIGADSLGYMPISELQSMVGDLPICRACFNNEYPIDVPDHEIRDLLDD